ncbi:MAG: Gfo/Idh/MocA family oxidoreductase [Methylacidiphilales bacterium]|nr:Gfo/Idh/MocA family oxidoreductase [Candidatus Methylacidiphilales bacterium]
MKEPKIKVGIIGVGSRGVWCFGKAIQSRDDAQVVALCDPNPVRMECAAKELDIQPDCHTTVESMIAAGKLDAVVITSPDFCHESNAVTALRGGVHVLIDKPLATTVKGCQNIISASEKSGKTLMMGFNLRHHNVLVKLKSLISTGVLGRIFLMENREFYDGGRTYMSRWNRLYAKSGGLWIHKGSHDFDVFNWLLDFPKPVKVSAFAGIDVLNSQHIPFEVKPDVPVGPTCHQCHYNEICPDVFRMGQDESWGDRAVACDGYAKDLCMYTSDKDTHDNGIAMVEYENGVKASHLECFITSVTDRLYTVVGDRGQAEVSLEKRTITIRPRWSQEVITHTLPEVQGGHGGADPMLVDAFVNVIRGQKKNTSTTAHGMWSTAIGQAAEISRREERTVQIAELFQPLD